MKYNAKELAEMAIRNYQEATKGCGDKPCNTDPTDCVAKVFAAPLETLEHVEQENAALRKEIETKRRALDSAVANIYELPQSVKEEFRKALPDHPFLK